MRGKGAVRLDSPVAADLCYTAKPIVLQPWCMIERRSLLLPQDLLDLADPCTLPAVFSALPFASSLGLSVIFPAIPPWPHPLLCERHLSLLSFVLNFMHSPFTMPILLQYLNLKCKLSAIALSSSVKLS